MLNAPAYQLGRIEARRRIGSDTMAITYNRSDERHQAAWNMSLQGLSLLMWRCGAGIR